MSISIKPVVAVHGGAGRWSIDAETEKMIAKVIKDSLSTGYDVLKNGGSALDAVVEATKVLENSEVFNAGLGSVLNALGYAEMDAGLMDGKKLRAAGVGAVRYPKNPIVLAKYVMMYTDHVLIVGEGADKLAKVFGLEARGSYIPQRIVDRYRELINNVKSVPYWKRLPEILPKILMYDTVGAVALDADGNVAAATSTGGIWLKLPGRIGDTPIVGAGFYADNRGGAVVATGVGEYITMFSLSRSAVLKMLQGLDALSACAEVLKEFTGIYGDNTAGVLCLDRGGRVAAVHNTQAMPYGFMNRDEEKIYFVGLKL